MDKKTAFKFGYLMKSAGAGVHPEQATKMAGGAISDILQSGAIIGVGLPVGLGLTAAQIHSSMFEPTKETEEEYAQEILAKQYKDVITDMLNQRRLQQKLTGQGITPTS